MAFVSHKVHPKWHIAIGTKVILSLMSYLFNIAVGKNLPNLRKRLLNFLDIPNVERTFFCSFIHESFLELSNCIRPNGLIDTYSLILGAFNLGFCFGIESKYVEYLFDIQFAVMKVTFYICN